MKRESRVKLTLLYIVFNVLFVSLITAWQLPAVMPTLIPPRFKVIYFFIMVLLFIVLMVFLWKYYCHHRIEVPTRRFEGRDLLGILLRYVLALLLMYFFYVLVSSRVFHTDFVSFSHYIVAMIVPDRYKILFYTGNRWMILLFLWGFIVAAPLAEEIIHRGILGSIILQPYSDKVRYVVTSAVFVMFHLPNIHNVAQWIGYFCGSLILYDAYNRRKSLMDSMLVHSLYNGLIVFFVYYLPEYLIR